MQSLQLPDGSEVNRLVVADYSSKPDSIIVPRFLEPESLCYAEFLPEQFVAATQDHRITILESVYSSKPNASVMTKQMADLGLSSGMTTHDILLRMYDALGSEVGFLPEN